MIEIDNFREITKKDKVYLPRTNIGLGRNALLIALLFGGVLWLVFTWWAIPMFVVILLVLCAFEFLDEDIYDILAIKFKSKTKNTFYA
ncbi:comB3 competence protein [Helicobacter fennelliae]|uniref:ComB3 competence protein n=1 Tax=Helicobacter fennelliae TaxID=215 RepID=A0A2X3ERG1_9HELI|nr:hypothetical protein [Helicobacter fennelliae]SQC36315.1 comB3 competence protein [Helicobacter fennelliae]